MKPIRRARPTASTKNGVRLDCGVSVEGALTRVTFDLASTASAITLAVGAAGDYRLPYQRVGVILPQAARRR
ncbi:MAG: hypothetical protein ACLPGW_10865 [Roseiarcus sp.]